MKKPKLLFMLMLCAASMSAQDVESAYNAMMRRADYELNKFSKISEKHPHWKDEYVLYKTNNGEIEAASKASATRSDYIYENEYVYDFSWAHEATKMIRAQVDSVAEKIESMMELTNIETLPEDDIEKRNLLDEIIGYYETGKADYRNMSTDAGLSLVGATLYVPNIDVKIEKVKKDAAKGIINKKFKKYINAYILDNIHYFEKVLNKETNDYTSKMRESKQSNVIVGIKDFTDIYYEMNGEKIINRRNVIFITD